MEPITLAASIAAGASFLVGAAVGYHSGKIVGRNEEVKRRQSKMKDLPPDPREKYKSLEEASKREVFDIVVRYADVRNNMLMPVRGHLKDVVSECRDLDDVRHRLRLVLVDLGKPDEAAGKDDVVAHFVRIHRDRPHLPFWLVDESLALYIKLVWNGLLLESMDEKDKDAPTADAVLDDLRQRAPAAMREDMGATPEDELTSIDAILSKGIERVRKVLIPLDPVAARAAEAEAEAEKEDSKAGV